MYQIYKPLNRANAGACDGFVNLLYNSELSVYLSMDSKNLARKCMLTQSLVLPVPIKMMFGTQLVIVKGK